MTMDRLLAERNDQVVKLKSIRTRPGFPGYPPQFIPSAHILITHHARISELVFPNRTRPERLDIHILAAWTIRRRKLTDPLRVPRLTQMLPFPRFNASPTSTLSCYCHPQRVIRELR